MEMPSCCAFLGLGSRVIGLMVLGYRVLGFRVKGFRFFGLRPDYYRTMYMHS